MALQRDIHASVSEQIKKNFYKAKWKVMYRKGFLRLRQTEDVGSLSLVAKRTGGGVVLPEEKYTVVSVHSSCKAF